MNTPEAANTDNEPAPENWWANEFIIQKNIDTPLSEHIEASTFDKNIDLLNFTEEPLTEAEIEQITNALNAIASYTGGKAFDRVRGVAFAPRSAFTEKDKHAKADDPDYKEVAGFYNAFSPVVMMNMEALRQPLSPEIQKKYEKFIAKRFPEGVRPTQLEYFLAHEFGHVMDLTYMSEIKKQIAEPDSVNPHWMGFTTTDGEDVVTKSFDAFEHPDPTVFLLEASLSARAREDASEDFAETFAIASLGGDISGIPRKTKKMIETIHNARGNEVIGPHKIETKKAAKTGRTVLHLVK